jgi:uncharacterized membrane protein YhaH (DUF805 family)
VPELLFSYEGRIGVRQFWLGLLSGLASTIALAMAVGVVLAVGLIVTGAPPEAEGWATFAGSAIVVGYAVFTQLAVTVKRCHDSGRSGWWSLLTLIPFVGLVWMIADLGLPRHVTVRNPVC